MKHLEYKDTNNKAHKTYYDKFKKMVKSDLDGDGWFLLVNDFPFKDGPNLMFTAGEDIGKWKDKNLVSLYGKTNYIIGRCRKKGPILSLLHFQEGDYIKQATESGLRKQLKAYFQGTGVSTRIFKSVKVSDPDPEIEEEELPEVAEITTDEVAQTTISELEMPALKPSSIQATLTQAIDMAKSLSVHETELFQSHLGTFQKAVPKGVMMKKALAKLNEYFADVVKNPKNSENQVKANVGNLITADTFGDIEKSLRNTRFKWGKTIRKTLGTAKENAQKMVEDSGNAEQIKLKLMGSPAADIKDEIALKIGGLRSDKYGTDSGYRKLSANKKALVDAIYNGMMAATVTAEGELEVPGYDPESVQKPGLRATFTKKKTIGGVAFKKGEKCVYIEKGEEHFIQQIAKKEKGTKGSFDEFEVKTNKLYKLDSQKDIKLQQTYKKTDKPVFDGPVSTSDIKQGAIGDCYLIAGIYSIAEKNPELIHNMIKDHGDGNVTVRLFKMNPGTKKLEPQLITFEKSTLSTDEHAEDSLWVQMIEKAYAIHIGSVEQIGKGGHTHDVFEAFLGVKSTQESIAGSNPTISMAIESMPEVSMTPSAFKEVVTRKSELELNNEQLEAIKEMTDLDLTSFYATIKNKTYKPIFANFFVAEDHFGVEAKSKDPERFRIAKEAWDKEKEMVYALQDKIRAIMSTGDRKKAVEKLLTQSKTYKKTSKQNILYQEDFTQIIQELKAYALKHPTISLAKKSYPIADLIEDLEAKGKESSYPPMDVSSHKGVEVSYKQSHLDTYDKISDGLKAGKYIAAGSKKYIGMTQGSGHSGGESMVDGLAGQHAYGVADVTEMNGRKFIRVSNPWGNDFSRDYDLIGGQLKSKTFESSDYAYLPDPEARKGGGINFNESWIELREFTGIFNNIYIT